MKAAIAGFALRIFRSRGANSRGFPGAGEAVQQGFSKDPAREIEGSR